MEFSVVSILFQPISFKLHLRTCNSLCDSVSQVALDGIFFFLALVNEVTTYKRASRVKGLIEERMPYN